MNWQPIETVPRDETPVLIYCPGEKWPILVAELGVFGWFVHGNEISGEMCGIDPEPTHWMTLPEPPTQEKVTP